MPSPTGASIECPTPTRILFAPPHRTVSSTGEDGATTAARVIHENGTTIAVAGPSCLPPHILRASEALPLLPQDCNVQWDGGYVGLPLIRHHLSRPPSDVAALEAVITRIGHTTPATEWDFSVLRSALESFPEKDQVRRLR